ncbi:glutathione S-transferase domain-containing protein [Caballeronia pedi]|uniref:Glutathione S-transferase domain-containing protein n=1 Tax=Caballeronia pedi TaxID=1777141 RepID=A0A158BC91_9BURK|nr:glutathione S-transferase [Caballeronia pedi]SAK67704.1 glutathione S-transferase domain-containing protein [Caballeronia pedi]
MKTDLTLYESKASPNSRRVRIFLAEKGIEVSIKAVDLGAKEQFSDAYVAINPSRQVPTLVLENGTAIGEVPAIWRYIEETYPGQRALLGTTPQEKALVTMWERRAELDGFAAVMEGVRNAVAGLKGRALSGPHSYEQIPEIVERSKLRVSNFYADFNDRLRVVPFVAGEAFSAADITTLATVDFAAGGMKMSIPEDFDALQAWYDRISDRPSSKA